MEQKRSSLSVPDESSQGTGKAPQRVLACTLCQSRKIKCDRKNPCGNCVKVGSPCVPASHQHRQRRRRFPERELLEKLRHYETLLRQNNIKFDPLHPSSSTDKPSPGNESKSGSSPNDAQADEEGDFADPASPSSVPTSTEPVSYWRALNSKAVEPTDDDAQSQYSQDDIHDDTFKKGWDQFNDNPEHLLFGSYKADIDVTSLRPGHVQIFQLWQIYLDNINPLLKVTHTPTLQGRIVEAASNPSTTSATLEALMFSIYCVAVLSLEKEECQTLFNSPRDDLLRRYQFGCQQSLLNCEFLRNEDRDCLTALYLYLISVKSDTDPRSLSSMLGIAVRLGYRMSIHLESSYAKHSALEGEMRRRLWWSLIIFDNRICEMCSYSQATTQLPTWDCRPPLNLNDSELRPEMKSPPAVHTTPTEALFVVARSELSDFVRCSDFYLDFINPYLKTMTKHDQSTTTQTPQSVSKLTTFGRVLENKYLSQCNPENALHYMTLWTIRMHYAQARMLEYYAMYSRPSMSRTDAARDTAISHAVSMIDYSTKLATSPLTKGFMWYIQSHFPFPAYIHILQDFRKRPLQPWAERGWQVMSDNWWIRFNDFNPEGNPFFGIFARIVLQAWNAREAALISVGRSTEPPKIVTDVRSKMPAPQPDAGVVNLEQYNSTLDTEFDDFLKFLPQPMDISGGQQLYGFGQQAALADMETWGYDATLGEAPINFDLNLNQVDWNKLT